MKQMNYKKLIIPNIPYVFFVYLFDKVGQAVRLAPGADISEKILNITQGFSEAFSNALPSVHPLDLLIGIVGAVVIRLIVYVKGKNAKKYRKGAEYGSARWGNAEDIKPYIDPDFQNNIILTQTERLTMNSRPKQPKYARNKNVVVIGGSGSGKTRFFVKPNLMQLHSSYVLTDPMSASIILQSQSQLKAIYKDAAEIILDNADSTLFLGGRGKNAKDISDNLGRETIDSFNTSENRGTQVSHGLTYQKLGKELMTQDEIAVMDGGKCILQLRGVRPFLSDKYDITKHPNYKYLSDFDKRNAFDVERYMSTRPAIVKPDEAFDIYEIDLSDEDAAAEE